MVGDSGVSKDSHGVSCDDGGGKECADIVDSGTKEQPASISASTSASAAAATSTLPVAYLIEEIRWGDVYQWYLESLTEGSDDMSILTVSNINLTDGGCQSIPISAVSVNMKHNDDHSDVSTCGTSSTRDATAERQVITISETKRPVQFMTVCLASDVGPCR